MYQLVSILALCLFSTCAWAQDATPATSSEGRPFLGLEVTGGVNIPTRRRARSNFVRASGLSAQPGISLGLNLVMEPEWFISFILGAEYGLDRGRIKNYEKSSSLSSNVVNISGDRSQTGSVDFSEQFLRLRGEIRYHLDKLTLSHGFQTSLLLAGTQTNEFVQTTRRFTDIETGTTIELADPIVSSGERELARNDWNGYASLLFGIAYKIQPRLGLKLEYDLGINIGTGDFGEEYRQTRQRATLGAYYLLLSR